MRTILLYSLLTLTLTGCFSGMGPSGLVHNGCGNNCSAKHFYLPNKGVWADDTKMSKAKIGGGLGVLSAVLLTHSSGDPLLILHGELGFPGWMKYHQTSSVQILFYPLLYA